MSKKATNEFAAEVVEVVEKYRSRGELTYAETIGALEIVKQSIVMESIDSDA